MIRKVKYIFLLMITFLINNNLVLANTNDNIVNSNKTGTVTINLKESNNNISLEGVEITIYKIATATSENNNLKFIYIDNIKKCNGDLSNLADPSLTSIIDKCINDKNLPLQTKLTNEEGLVKFDNLELGLYLVKQTNKVEGYSNIDPFLVTIPKEMDNKWTYEIVASPKTDSIRLMDIIVEKKWDAISNNTPKEVTIQLLKEDEIIDTIILNEENNWTYTWKQIERSDKYSVKEINIPTGYTATYRQIENKFIITNTKTLVQTGQNTLLIELLLISGLIFILLGIIYNKRKKIEKN